VSKLPSFLPAFFDCATETPSRQAMYCATCEGSLVECEASHNPALVPTFSPMS
jgi:hypothetical protein